VNIRYRSVFNVLSTLVAYALQSKKLSSKFFAPNPELALKKIERVLNHRPKKMIGYKKLFEVVFADRSSTHAATFY
jgi:hypothetical protein